MLKIRLARVGAKKQPKYRIAVAEEQFKQSGRFLEILGNYDPTRQPAKIELKLARYQHWRNQGAQPTKAVLHLAKRYEKTNRVSS